MPKTATHAIRKALSRHLGPDDWEQQFLFGEQVLPISELARLRHGHISAMEIRPHLSESDWDTYFKFAFVRNPFDRFVSTCFFLNRDNPNFAEGAADFMKRALTVPRFRQRVLVRPQYQLLTDARGQIALDKVGRYENLQASYDAICAKIGIPPSPLRKTNESKHNSFVEYYDDDLRAIVADFYKDDLNKFGYDFPSG